MTDRLLTVDPEWSWEPLALGPDGLPALDRSGNLWIKLTICGVTRLGVGDGKNAKEVIGDAIRNAAMRFGVALDLWAKENLVEFAQTANTATRRAEQPKGGPVEPEAALVPQPTDSPVDKPMTDSTRGRMFGLFGDLGIVDTEQLPGINRILGTDYESRGRLTEAEAKQVIAVLKRKKEAAA